MSSNQEIDTKTENVDTVEEKSNNLKDKIKGFLGSWKLKLAIAFIFVTFSFLTVFYWQHLMAVMGMKMWASHANGKPIDCMMKDSNEDEYISCTAKMDDQIVPLECGTSILNLGCRVNYGTASPSLKALKSIK